MARLFSTISIETGARCNRKCWFCPNATNKRPDEFMSISMIHSIAQNLSGIDYSDRIEFYIYNEPLLDSRILSIIETFRRTCPKACLMLASNGDLISTSAQISELFEAGLNQLQINIYSGMSRFRKMEQLIKQVDCAPGDVYKKISPKARVYSLEKKFTKLITPDSNKCGKFELSNRSGNVPALGKLEEPLSKSCVRPFRYMQINWKGDVILCCNDYHGEVVCGNVKEQRIEDIWFHSEILQKYRKSLLRKERHGLKLCHPCSFKGGAYPHFLPKFWQELL
jgi:MoaA/NifB/PqqE/SkfB family radical SAM enzyme